ncbi:MAG: septum formation initiator family protein [Proteobacteria bacterium]|nr:septum formation initiator family protein [Pseudomonadota bacterium]
MLIYTLWSRCIIVALLGILLNGVIRGERTLSDYVELKEKRDLLSEVVDKLEAESQAISVEIHRIRHSHQYAKKVLRSKYHIMEDNEELIFFEDE